MQVLTEAFSVDSYRLLTATNAGDGFEILAQNRIDIVICDNDMNSMSGVQFLTRVRKLYANTLRVLASSGDDAPTLTRATNMAGIHLFLPRSWAAERLRNEVRELIRSGKSDQEIKDFLVSRYGDFVLYRPEVKPLTWVLWFGPFVLLVMAAIFLGVYLRQRRALAAPVPMSDEARERAKQLLKG